MPKHFTAELCMLLTLLLVVATLCASSALPTGGGGGYAFGAPRHAGARLSVAERARFLPGMSE